MYILLLFYDQVP